MRRRNAHDSWNFMGVLVLRSPLVHTLLASLPILLLMTQCASRISVHDPVMRVESSAVLTVTSSPYLTREFARAQRNLVQGTLLDNILRRGLHTFPMWPRLSEKQMLAVAAASPENMAVQIIHGPVPCGKNMGSNVKGCFMPGKINGVRIRINPNLPGAAYHEFIHLLLYDISDSRFLCSLHDYNFNGRWDCYE